MKICFIAPYAYPLFDERYKNNFGGAEIQLFNLANELSQKPSFSVYFITSDVGQKDYKQFNSIQLFKSFAFSPEYSNANHIQKLSRFFSRILKGLSFYRLLKRINADVYIQRNAGAETGLCAFFSRFHKKLFVYSVAHDMDCDGAYAADNRLKGKMYLYGLNKADVVIAQTKQQSKLLKNNYNISSYTMNTAYTIPNINHAHAKYVLWVGRITELKRPHMLLNIARQMKDYKFIMIGQKSCSDDDYHAFIDEVASIENIEYIPYVRYPLVHSYFKDASLIVHTACKEGFPNVFVQAWMHGKPVIALGVNPDDIIEKYHLGFAAQSIDDCVKHITNLYANAPLYQTMSHNAYVYAQVNHNIKTIVNQLTNIIERKK